MDTMPTTPSALTHYKTSLRAMYDSARTRAGIQSLADRREVILVDDAGRIMEGSLTTPYFWRGGRWVTPPATRRSGSGGEDDGEGEWQGGQDGTTRRWALRRGIVEEETVLAASVVEGEEVWISNGVRGFIRGVMRLG